MLEVEQDVEETDLVETAAAHGCRLHDVRVPSVQYPIANGKKRSGKRCLTVGTDCSVGKMYTAMAMDAEMRKRGLKSTFRATGHAIFYENGTSALFSNDGKLEMCNVYTTDDPDIFRLLSAS